MKNKLVLLLLSLLAIHISAAKSQEFVFAFSWLGGFCDNKCLPSKYSLWDSKSFSIHGLWSQNRNQSRIFGDFDLSLIAEDQVFADKLMSYMPPQSKSTQTQVFLWGHEWAAQKLSRDGHGHDYGHFHVSVHPETYKDLPTHERNSLVQKAYFRKIVSFYESFPNVKKIGSSKLNWSNLVSIFNRKPSQMKISCMVNSKKDKGKGCRIKEVQVCAILDDKQEIKPAACQGTNLFEFDKNYGASKSVFILPEWGTISPSQGKDYDSSRVIQKDSALQTYLQNYKLSKMRKSAAPIQSEMAVNLDEAGENDEDNAENEDSGEQEHSYFWSLENEDDGIEKETDSSSDSSESL